MPIINKPSAEKLNDFALVLYFQAWCRLVEVFIDFDMTFEGGKTDWVTEWEEYVELSQKDLETIVNLAAQSAEIALKSRLCATSPFLLLIGQGAPLKTTMEVVDFTDLRTIDAVDLPGAVNTFCDVAVSDRFIEQFNNFRRLRNKALHLGDASNHFSPDKLVENLVTLFCEIWPSKSWLREWVRSISRGRSSFFHDGRYASAHSEVFDMLPFIVDNLTKGQFMRLIGEEKSKRRYYCFNCLENASIKSSDWTGTESVKTAHLGKSGKTLRCSMCEETFPVIRRSCPQDLCKGDVLTVEQSKNGESWCHSCSLYSDEI